MLFRSRPVAAVDHRQERGDELARVEARVEELVEPLGERGQFGVAEVLAHQRRAETRHDQRGGHALAGA